MTLTELAEQEFELAKKLLNSSLEAYNEKLLSIAKELYELCENSVERCKANPDLFGIDIDLKTYKLYRVENEKEGRGLWRRFDGTWDPLFDMLSDGKCKDMPMGDDPLYREEGKQWFASAPSKEILKEWFSKKDLEELISKGFTITEFEVTNYKIVSEFEYIFTRDSVIGINYLKIEDIYD